MNDEMPSRSPELGELRDEPVDRADEHLRRGEVVVDVDLDAGPGPDPVEDVGGLLARMVGELRRAAGRVDVELQRVEPVAGRVADPADLLLGRGDRDRARVGPDDVPAVGRLQRPRREPDDVRLAAREREHPLAATADEQGRMRLLDRRRLPVVLGDRVVLARERERPLGEAALEHRDRLGETRDAHAGGVERDAERGVLRPVPAGAERDLHAAPAQHVERGEVLGQERGMTQVVVGHERRDPQPVGGRGDRREQGHEPEREHDVVGIDEHVVADRLRATRGLAQGRAVGDLARVGEEAERPHATSRSSSPMTAICSGRG